MDANRLAGQLAFLREAERLKSVLRSAHTATGRPESTAEHSWRLCLMAIVFERELAPLDLRKILKLCVIHDLGEALHGDVPAVEQAQHPNKSAQERQDLLTLTQSLDAAQQADILALWQEYEDAATPEAQAAMHAGLDGHPKVTLHDYPGLDHGFAAEMGNRRDESGATIADKRTAQFFAANLS